MDKVKVEMVTKEWKRIKVELTSTFWAFLWMAFIVKCKVVLECFFPSS